MCTVGGGGGQGLLSPILQMKGVPSQHNLVGALLVEIVIMVTIGIVVQTHTLSIVFGDNSHYTWTWSPSPLQNAAAIDCWIIVLSHCLAEVLLGECGTKCVSNQV